MYNRNDGPVKFPKGENFWSQPYEEPLLQSKPEKIIEDFTHTIDQAHVLLTPAKLNKEKFENFMKNDFAKKANLYNELLNKHEIKDIQGVQKKLGELQKKISLSKSVGHEIPEILSSLESKEAKKMSEIPAVEEVEKLTNDFSTQIDTLKNELDRLFKFSTSLSNKHGTVSIFKQAKDVLKADVEKVLQQLTHHLVKTLALYGKIYQETNSDQRNQISDKLSEIYNSAIDLTNLFNHKLSVKPLYTIDSDLQKKAADIVETIARYKDTADNLGYVPPKLGL